MNIENKDMAAITVIVQPTQVAAVLGVLQQGFYGSVNINRADEVMPCTEYEAPTPEECERIMADALADLENSKRRSHHLRRGESLYERYPLLAEEYCSWNPVPPHRVRADSRRVAYWHCFNCQTNYKASVEARTKMGINCPRCAMKKAKKAKK